MQTSNRLDLSLPARAESAPVLRAELRSFLNDLPVPPEVVSDVLLAAGEAAANAIEHAYRGCDGFVRLHAYIHGARLVVEVHDAGNWRMEGESDRGRGIGIMHALVDTVSIESSQAGTAVRLELRIA